MEAEPVLIGGAWRKALAPKGSFAAINPATGERLKSRYPVSSFGDIDAALQASRRAASELRSVPPVNIAAFLYAYADRIEKRGDALVKTASLETALPEEPRLRSVELPRTTDQLRQAAAACRDRSWCRATIDAKNNIRSKHGPLGGAVVIFGPGNFPFAFNPAAGGDFAAAVASGNPVIAKAHPGHPGTTKIFAEAALEILKESNLPRGMVQLLYHFEPEDGLTLAAHPLTGATAFTGSRPSGLRLKKAADKAGKPVYLEMSSLNPVILLPGSLEERSDEIAQELFTSCTMGSGQFCTKPGLVILKQGLRSEAFFHRLLTLFRQAPAGILLGQNTLNRLREAIAGMARLGAEIVTGNTVPDLPGYRLDNTLLRISGERFLEHPRELQIEAFGSVSLVVFAEDDDRMMKILEVLDGDLTGAIYSDSRDKDEGLYKRIEPVLRLNVGRLLNDKMPTGVAISPAMSHGGPFPATGHPGFTSVGIPASLLRFSALHCYDNVRARRLPEEIRDKNPTGRMWRFIDGEWTRRDL
ncbi:MAG: aldehyde dehydrogenase (NADP(+)) [Candidatus Aminicenantes bacterium]|nr:aldehyde dehydrogenase (NADP(+)) [Candidatus Aminicenantes bacterium]